MVGSVVGCGSAWLWVSGGCGSAWLGPFWVVGCGSAWLWVSGGCGSAWLGPLWVVGWRGCGSVVDRRGCGLWVVDWCGCGLWVVGRGSAWLGRGRGSASWDEAGRGSWIGGWRGSLVVDRRLKWVVVVVGLWLRWLRWWLFLNGFAPVGFKSAPVMIFFDRRGFVFVCVCVCVCVCGLWIVLEGEGAWEKKTVGKPRKRNNKERKNNNILIKIEFFDVKEL